MYVARLRSLLEYCNFGPLLDEIAWSAGLKHLLAQSALPYVKAVELALSAENAAQSMRELGIRSEGGSTSRLVPQEVHKTSTSGASPV